MKKVFISGKMSGLTEEESKLCFSNAEERLKRDGYDVVNPWDIPVPSEYADQLLESLHVLAQCDAIYMLHNWDDSNGSQCEYYFAKGSGMEIIFENDYLREKLENGINEVTKKISELTKKSKNF